MGWIGDAHVGAIYDHVYSGGFLVCKQKQIDTQEIGLYGTARTLNLPYSHSRVLFAYLAKHTKVGYFTMPPKIAQLLR